MEHHNHVVDQFTIGRKLKFVGILFIFVVALSFHPALKALNQSLFDYLKLVWWAIILGLVLGGAIEYFIPEQFVFKLLGQRNKSSLIYAVLGGFIFSACSHGILAIAIQLYKKGASIPSVVAFLLASPWANLSVTIILFGFFGWRALLFIFAAIIIAFITGLIFMILGKLSLIEPSRKVEDHVYYNWNRITHFNFIDSLKGVSRGTLNISNMVLWWILLGIMTASLIGAYIPEHFFHQYFGPSLMGLVLTLAFATIVEVCSEGSAPIAFEIFNKVGAIGNPFVFLMAGVVTDYTEIGLLWTNIGKKTAIWLPIVTVPQVLIVGYLFNLLV